MIFFMFWYRQKIVDNISFYFNIVFQIWIDFNFYWHSIVKFTQNHLKSLKTSFLLPKMVFQVKKWKDGFKDILHQIILLYLALKPTQFLMEKCLFHLYQTSKREIPRKKIKNHYFLSMISIRIKLTLPDHPNSDPL